MIRRTLPAVPVLVCALLAAGAVAQAGIPRVAPDVTKLAIAPAAFRALPSGPAVVMAGGASVSFTVAEGTNVDFAVKIEKPGRRAGRTCVAGKAKQKSGSCVRTVAMPGTFKFIAIPGANDLRFSGRIGDKTLAPGRYRLVAKAEGQAARSSFVSFKIIR